MNFLTFVIDREGGDIRFRLEADVPEPTWLVPESSPWVAPLRGIGTGRVDLGLRPEHTALVDGPVGTSVPMAIPAEVRRIESLGHEAIATLGVGPYEVRVRDRIPTRLRPGERVDIDFDPARVIWFHCETGMAL